MMTMTMLTSRTAPRARPLQARAAVDGVLARSNTSTPSVRFYHSTQVRAFRFGMWSSCFDSAYHRELRRRQRELKQKYVDHINQRLSWHDFEHPLAREPRLAIKQAMARLWMPTATRHTLRWLNQDEPVGQKPSTPRPPHEPWGKYVDHIFDSPLRQAPPNMNTHHDMQTGAEHPRKNSTSKMPKSQEPTRSKTSSIEEQDYLIDPITNRRVPNRDREPPEIEIESPTRTFKTYRSQFTAFTPPNLEPGRPVYSSDAPPASELNKYAESNFDDWPATSTQASAVSAKTTYFTEPISYIRDNSQFRNEEYALNHLPLDDPIEDYGNIRECQTAASDGPLEKPLDNSNHHDTGDRVAPTNPNHTDHLHGVTSKPDQLQSELQGYGPYMHNEDSPLHDGSQYSQDLEQYRHRHLEELEPSTETSIVYDDLHKYKPAAFEDFEKKDQPFEQYGDLEKYKAFRLQHLDTPAAPEQDAITESLKEYEAKEQDTSAPYLDSTSFNPKPLEAHQSTVVNQNADGGCSEIPSSAMNSEAPQPTPDQLHNITGSEKPVLNHIASARYGDNLDHYFGADLYSKAPQGLETSFSEECGGKDTMPLYRRTYGGEPGQVAPTSKPIVGDKAQESLERSSSLYYDRDPEIDGVPLSESADLLQPKTTSQSAAPTVYKILAYDPTMQTINIAETSSVVPDLTSPLSPSEVLLRLSNPTKFFPHFAPLQAEGFEIVSGGGDVLVFRQVRPAKPIGQGGATHVNPIDLMGRSTAVPNAAAFVSPTGFVNYDMPRVEEELVERAYQASRGRSVRREEPVFSGQKSSSGDKRGKKPRMNVGKRVIVGGVWVAGLSYALGVVTEYFATGGTDGKGPTGFSPE
ncbi:hypothetical protein GGR51DRAFT_460518 [Nemania sp. FL0031]|nr:hypothetical protein GGR51DRAFT_460518 [Nemania sp. FL0031]